MNLQEVGWWDMEWINLTQDRGREWAFMNVVMSPWVS